MHLIENDVMARLQALPKVELHNHLEGGAMYPDLALKLAERNKMTLPFSDEESAKAFYEFTSLDQFIDILRVTVATLNTAEDYADAVERHGIEAAKQNIRYHELFLTYGLVASRGVKWPEVIEGVEEGRRRNKIHGVDTAFIVDLDRTLPIDTAMAHTKKAVESMAKTKVVGMGLDCQENGYPAGRLKECFQYAASNGLPLTAHAGEDGGSESIWDALDCGVERIDHGVQAVEDARLLEELCARQVLLTVCPISNVALKVFPSMEQHSLPQLLKANIPVCLNSDDPPMFNSNLMQELIDVESTFSLGEEQLTLLLRNAIVHSFQPRDDKAALIAEFDATVSAGGCAKK